MTTTAPQTAARPAGYVPGHIMQITSPPRPDGAGRRPPWWPRPSCSCGWEGDEQESRDAARDAHADHTAGLREGPR